MLNKNFLFVIILSCFIFSKNYSNNFNVKFEDSTVKVETVYYENNKWNFIEDELVDKVDAMPINDGFQACTIGVLFTGLTWLGIECLLRNDPDKGLTYATRSLLTLILMVYIINLLPNKSVTKELKQNNLLNVMDNFFQNYSIDLNSKLAINYRNFVPKELLSTFDVIFESYQKDGTDCLNSFVNIFNSIRNKFALKCAKQI